MSHYEFHPIANIFPLIDGQSYQELLADVLKHGVREPIWIYEGKILDGRNRYRAAMAMRVECPIQEYTGPDAVAFVISLNLHRRHLNESQRGMVGAKLANMQQGQRTDIQPSANLQNVSQADAAEMLNVSTRTVAAASKVQAEAPQEVTKAVEAGDISINLATQFVALPDESKQEAIAAIAEGSDTAKEVIREAVKKAHVANNSGNNEWYTPSKHIELAREVMGGIDCDPATSEIANRTVQAETIFTADDDGRYKSWSKKAWMNPAPCSCGIHPKIIQSLDGNKNLPQLSESLAAHIGMVLAEGRDTLPIFLVQRLREGESKTETTSTERRPNRVSEDFGGKKEIFGEREGDKEQEEKFGNQQPQTEGSPLGNPVAVEYGVMGTGSDGMGLRLRLLWNENEEVDTRPFHSFIESCLSGDGSLQHGPNLPELQFEQGVSDASRLVTGQAATCDHCGLAGFAVVTPSRVFLNPPYAQPLMGDFAEAVSAKFESGEIEQACILVNNATETQWFQRMLVSASAVCFPKSRIKFLDPQGNPSGAPLQGQAIVYMGDSVEAFQAAFKQEGAVLING